MFSVVTKALGAIVGMVPVIAGLAGLHGDTPQQQQDTITSAATAILDTVEGMAGKTFAADADVQTAARAVVAAVQALHAIIAAKTAAATPAK